MLSSGVAASNHLLGDQQGDAHGNPVSGDFLLRPRNLEDALALTALSQLV